MHLLSSDDQLREELRTADREFRRAMRDKSLSEEDRALWLEMEREVREHRRWRQLTWLIVVWPIIFTVIAALLLGLGLAG